MLKLLVTIRWFIDIFLYFSIIVSSSAIAYSVFAILLDCDIYSIQFWSLLILLSFLAIGYIIKSSSKKMEVRASYFIIASSLNFLPILTLFDKESVVNIFTNNIFLLVLGFSLFVCLLFKYIYRKIIYSIIFIPGNEINLNLPEDDADIENIKRSMLSSVASCIKQKYKNDVLVQGKQFLKDNKNTVVAVFELYLSKKLFGFITVKLIDLELQYTV